MKYLKIIITFLLVAALISCGGEKKKPVFLTEDTEMSEDSAEDDSWSRCGEEEVVPFRNENGVKYVPVKVNGVGLEMVFDTGCSASLISVAEANYLYQKGTLTQDDLLGSAQSQIADGSIVENMVVNLKEVIIDDKIKCTDVVATVSNNANAPLLLGNDVLDRLATIKIDNENETLIFKLKR